jgi:Zn-dependent protease
VSAIVIAAVIGLNLGLIFVLMGLPLGRRTIRASRVIRADRARLWDALHPLGRQAGWSGEILSAQAVRQETQGQSDVRLVLSWEGRDGRPIERTARLVAEEPGRRFGLTVVDDTSLDHDFWRDYSEETLLEDAGGAVRVTVSQTDRYRGLAFLAFRWFRLRRMLAGLKRWGETGLSPRGGVFEHPVTQAGLAGVSALVLWPFFGLGLQGFVMAACLTLVVALHELGHLAAFRLMGHRKVRMIFIPILGGVAIGGRPYDSRFEVAFVALMGAGFSAFLVPLAIGASELAAGLGERYAAAVLATFAGFLALFNLANLVPVWRFDGGQVLRQIIAGDAARAAASFALLGAFMGVAALAGFDWRMVLGAGAVFAVLGLITTGLGVKPRHDLKPIAPRESAALAAALVAAFVVHASAVLWAADLYDRHGRSVADGHALPARVGAALEPPVRAESDAVQARVHLAHADLVAERGQIV